MTAEKQEKKGKKRPDDAESAEKAADAAGKEPSGPAEPEPLEGLRAQAAERDEFLDLLKRTRAEFSNYRKRVERDRSEWTGRSIGDFVLRLLPVLDDFHRALAHAAETADFETFVHGIRLIENKIYDVLKASGVEPFEPVGEVFNPAEHEAVIVEPSDELPDETISEVLLKGYRLGARVLRPAQVKVVRKPAASPREQSGETPAGETEGEHHTGGEEGESDANV